MGMKFIVMHHTSQYPRPEASLEKKLGKYSDSNNPVMHNGDTLMVAGIIKTVVSSVKESDVAGLLINRKGV